AAHHTAMRGTCCTITSLLSHAVVLPAVERPGGPSPAVRGAPQWRHWTPGHDACHRANTPRAWLSGRVRPASALGAQTAGTAARPSYRLSTAACQDDRRGVPSRSPVSHAPGNPLPPTAAGHQHATRLYEHPRVDVEPWLVDLRRRRR